MATRHIVQPGPDVPANLKPVDANARMEELERRVGLAETIKETKGDPFGDDRQPILSQFGTFEDSSQRFLVVNFAHRDQRPKKDRPALRILGAFESEAEADDYIRTAAPLLVGCNMWKLETMRWFMVCKNMMRQQDSSYTLSKIDVLKSLFLADKARRDKEFADMRAAKQQGKTDQSLEKQKQKGKEQRQKKLSSRLKALQAKARETKGMRSDPTINETTTAGTNGVPPSLIQRKQDYCVVSWMRDVTKPAIQCSDDPEPACIVWRLFPTYELAKEWMQGMGSQRIRDFDMEVVDTYEWLFPEDVDREKMQEMYRHSEQNKVMLQRKAEADKVVNFEHWCKEKGVEVPVTEVVADLPLQGNTSITAPEAENVNPIRLQSKAFDMKVETKNANEDLKVIDYQTQFDFLHRPLLQHDQTAPTTGSAPTVDTIHAPVDE